MELSLCVREETEEVPMVEEISNEVRGPHDEPQVLADLQITEASTTRRRVIRRPPLVQHRPITRSLTRAARLAADPNLSVSSPSSHSGRTTHHPSLGLVDPTFTVQPSHMAPTHSSRPRMPAKSRNRSYRRTARRPRRSHATSKRRRTRRKGSSSPNHVDNRNQSYIVDIATTASQPSLAHCGITTHECPSLASQRDIIAPSIPSHCSISMQPDSHPPHIKAAPEGNHPGQFSPSRISHSQLSSVHAPSLPVPHHTTHVQPSPHQKHQAQTSLHIGHHAELSAHQKDHAPTSPHQDDHAELSPYEVFSMQQHQAAFVQSVLHRGMPRGQASKSQQISESSPNVRLDGSNIPATNSPDAKPAHDGLKFRKRASAVVNEQVAKQMRIAHRKRANQNQKSPVQQAPLQQAGMQHHVLHDVQNAPSQYASQVQQASSSASPRHSVLTDASTSIRQAPHFTSPVLLGTPNQVAFVQHFSPEIRQVPFPVSRVTQASSPVQPMPHHVHSSMQQDPYYASPMQIASHNVPLGQQSQEMPLNPSLKQQPQHHLPYRNQYSDETLYGGETSCAASLIPGLSESPLHMPKASELKLPTPRQKFVQQPQHVISAPTPRSGSPNYMGALQPSSQATFYNQQPNGPLFSANPDTILFSANPDTMSLKNNVSVQRASQYHAQNDRRSAIESLPPKQQSSHTVSPSSTFMALPSPPPPPPSPSHSCSTSSPSHRQSHQGDLGAYKAPQSNQRRSSGSSLSALPSLSQSTSPSELTSMTTPSKLTSPSTSRSSSTVISSANTQDHQRLKTPCVQYMHP